MNSPVGLVSAAAYAMVGTRIRGIVTDSLTGRQAEAALHHLEGGGKHLRGTFALAAATAEGIGDSDAWRIALACELLHNASLIHDDIIDRDEVRRGRPSIWVRYGVTTAILLGDGFIGLAFKQIAGLSNPAAAAALFRLFADTLLTMIDGEADEATNFGIGTAPSQETFAAYRRICTQKTAPLFELALVASFLSVCRPEVDIRTGRATMRHIGFAYQLLDDAKDGDRYQFAGVPDSATGRLYLVEQASRHCRTARELTAEHAEIPSMAVVATLADALLAECDQISETSRASIFAGSDPSFAGRA